MKAPQGVFIGDSLFIGSGYTSSLDGSTNIYTCTDSSDSWTTLPPLSRELKLPALTSLGNKLVILGGKEPKPNFWGSTCTNRVEVWDTEKRTWEESSMPPMIAPRVSPVVVRHDSHIIVAGGNPGVLDFRAELLDTSASPMRWLQCPNLPLQCNSKTSAVVGNRWYLLDLSKGDILYTELDCYVDQTLCDQKVTSGRRANDLKWEKVPKKPSEDAIPFQLTAFGTHLIAFTNVRGKLFLHLLQDDSEWLVVGGHGLPLTISSAALILSREEDDALLVLGGENSAEYSNKSYKVSFTTSTKLKEIKKKWRVTLNYAPT